MPYAQLINIYEKQIVLEMHPKYPSQVNSAHLRIKIS